MLIKKIQNTLARTAAKVRAAWCPHPDRGDAPDAITGDSANDQYKRAARRRQRISLAGAALLLLLIALLGPSREKVRRYFEFHPGAAGPLRVMPELSIDQGRDTRNQEPERFRNLWRPPPEQQEIEPKPSGEPIAPPQLIHFPETAPEAEPIVDPDLRLADAVEMRLPQQTSRCFVLTRLVRPEYPLGADEIARQMPLVNVEVAFYVNERGVVTASYILSSDGGSLFDEAVLKAVDRWRFRPVDDPACPPLGFWIRLPVAFHSPYAPRPR